MVSTDPNTWRILWLNLLILRHVNLLMETVGGYSIYQLMSTLQDYLNRELTSLFSFFKFGRSIIMRESKRFSTLWFGVPNVLKFGEVGYFSEEPIKDFSLQELTALEIEHYFIQSGMDIDGDIICRWSVEQQEPVLMYFVNLRHNIFEKYNIDVS